MTGRFGLHAICHLIIQIQPINIEVSNRKLGVFYRNLGETTPFNFVIFIQHLNKSNQTILIRNYIL